MSLDSALSDPTYATVCPQVAKADAAYRWDTRMPTCATFVRDRTSRGANAAHACHPHAKHGRGRALGRARAAPGLRLNEHTRRCRPAPTHPLPPPPRQRVPLCLRPGRAEGRRPAPGDVRDPQGDAGLLLAKEDRRESGFDELDRGALPLMSQTLLSARLKEYRGRRPDHVRSRL